MHMLFCDNSSIVKYTQTNSNGRVISAFTERQLLFGKDFVSFEHSMIFVRTAVYCTCMFFSLRIYVIHMV